METKVGFRKWRSDSRKVILLMSKALLTIVALLITLSGCDFERAAHYEVGTNSNTVTLWHEIEVSAACKIHLESEVVGQVELPKGEKWVFQYEGQPNSIYALCH